MLEVFIGKGNAILVLLIAAVIYFIYTQVKK